MDKVKEFRLRPVGEQVAACFAALCVLPWLFCTIQYHLWALPFRFDAVEVRVTPNGYAYHRRGHYEGVGGMTTLFHASHEMERSACRVCYPPSRQYRGQPAAAPDLFIWLAVLGSLFLARLFFL